ncbi:MAG: AraC family transcriptional regulator [Gammaproteobacteria bacterium]|nr:AraC family transcriptional regulator [Gammaproteobacteria bacterium]
MQYNTRPQGLKTCLKKLETVVTSIQEPTEPRFWRDETLPFIEARSIHNGRKVSYAKHAHETFSIGIVRDGHCTYSNGKTLERISAGAVVVMNPGDAHACNPIDDELWSYRMLYVDVPWLVDIQRDLGISRNDQFRPFSTTVTTQAGLYVGLNRLYHVLIDQQAEHLQKHGAALAFMLQVQQTLIPAHDLPPHGHRGLMRAAEFIRDNYTRSLKLDEICSAASLSASYLIRAFKNEYGMTPHAYLINCRIEFCRSQLRRGRPIADVALAAGFSDQAHLQRSFKKVVAATPGQYRA